MKPVAQRAGLLRVKEADAAGWETRDGQVRLMRTKGEGQPWREQISDGNGGWRDTGLEAASLSALREETGV